MDDDQGFILLCESCGGEGGGFEDRWNYSTDDHYTVDTVCGRCEGRGGREVTSAEAMEDIYCKFHDFLREEAQAVKEKGDHPYNRGRRDMIRQVVKYLNRFGDPEDFPLNPIDDGP